MGIAQLSREGAHKPQVLENLPFPTARSRVLVLQMAGLHNNQSRVNAAIGFCQRPVAVLVSITARRELYQCKRDRSATSVCLANYWREPAVDEGDCSK